ncbi:MAG: exonuclease SbcCD subunit D [Oscillospiraceae bacterium]|nr:exonuclease SbcCD subunit D [Oscillospiraceae bacterium]
MRFIHLADLHLGKSLHGVNLLESGDQPVWVDRFLALAAEVRPDAVLIAGDVYDRGAPAAGAVELLSRLITGLTALGIAVLAVPGNHDSAPRLAFGRELLARAGFHAAPPLRAPGLLTRVSLTDEHGPVDFWLLPYLFPALAAEALGTELRDYDAAVRAVLAAQPLDPTRRNVLLAHQNVTAGGAEGERGGSESAVGGVGQVEYTAFDAFDYAALGHIHAGYPVGRPAVRYAGSPLCYHFNETKQAAKGPLLVELGAKGSPVTVTLLPIEPLHRLRVLEGAYEALRAELSGALPSPEDQYLSITLTDRRVTPELAEDLRARCEARGSLLMELRSVWQEARSEAALRVSALREQGLAELFAAFCAQRSGTEPDEAELALLRSAEALAEQADHRLEPEPEQIDRLLAEALRKTKS